MAGDEITDGGCPCRPVRHHFGITPFGANASTGAAVGDRAIDEHDEAGDALRDEPAFTELIGSPTNRAPSTLPGR